MGTIRLFDDQPYNTDFSAKVLACMEDGDSFRLVLDRTQFFPEEGGQLPDRGIIVYDGNAFQVNDVQEENGVIYHAISSLIPTGAEVSGEIDWDYRFNSMQQHTGEHIFSGIVNSRFGFDNVGFHLGDREATMDYNGTLSEEDLNAIEYAANEAVISNIPVECRYPSAPELASISYRSKKEIDGPIRIVTIPGVDTCACCAPHVRTTGEIGIIKLLSAHSHRGGTRVTILCGFRALQEFNALQDAAGVVSREYSVPVSAETFTEAISKRNSHVQELKDRLSSIQGQLLDMQLENTDSDSSFVILFAEGLDEVKKRELLNRAISERKGFCSVFDGNDETGYSFIIASADQDCHAPLELLKIRLGAKGGGKNIMVQGSVHAPAEAIRATLEQ